MLISEKTKTGNYPWNQPPAAGDSGSAPSSSSSSSQQQLHPLVTRVTTWGEVQARVEALWAEYHHQE